MKTQLYYYPGNANLAAHLLLEEAACEYELVLVDRAQHAQKGAEYLRINPNGTIPTLVSGPLVLFETAAICLHIADQHPAARLAPPLGSLERAQLYKWLFFLSNTVQPAYMQFRYPEQHVSFEGGVGARHPDAADAVAADAVAAVRTAAAERAARAFEVIEQTWGTAGPFLLGEEYSACDAYLYMLAWWARKLPRPPARLPRLRACVAAVAARAATKRACVSEGVDVYDPSSAGSA
jgi:glutathione S-transferase